MSIAYIGVGSNINPALYVSKAKRLLETHSRSLVSSPFYRTAPLQDRYEQEDYSNGVFKIEIDNTYTELKLLLRDIENQCDRVRVEGDTYVSRTLDLDILLFDNIEIDGELPNSDIFERNFVYFPLLEIEPNLRLPNGELLRDMNVEFENDLVIDDRVRL